MNKESTYLTNIPQFIEEYGLCKTLMVRRETIHIKHILTEIFVRKTIDIEKMLDYLNLNIYQYMEILTNKLRRVHKISRNYQNKFNRIVKTESDDFTRMITLYNDLNGGIILDFDGVLTNDRFIILYHYFKETLNVKTFVCSGNPTVSNEWFLKRGYSIPDKIYANKGKIKKIKKLIELSKKNDYLFYIDNEKEYLKYAWIFGIKTYHWDGKKIRNFTLNSK